MKTNRKRTRLLAILLSFSLFFGQIPAPAFADEPLATPTDLTEETTVQATEEPTETPAEEPAEEPGEEPGETPEDEPDEPEENGTEEEDPSPYEQQETIDGVLVTVTADEDVIAEDARLQIRTVNEPKFTAAAEEALEIRAGETTIIRHTVYEFTGAEIRGVAKVKLEKLKLTDLKNAYPDGELSVYVLRDKDNDREGAERADRIAASVQPDRNTVSFLITETGRYDLVTVVRLPEETVIPDQGSVVSSEEPDETEEPVVSDQGSVVSPKEPDETEEPVVSDQGSVGSSEEPVPASPTDLTDEEKEELPETLPETTEEISFSKGAKPAVSLRALGASPDAAEEGVQDETGEEPAGAALLRAGADTQSLTVSSPVSYRDGEQTKEISEYTVVGTTTTVWNVNSSDGEGWYIASGSSAYVANRIEIAQNKVVNLILCDDSTLQAPYGIHIPNGSRLIIWAQDKGNGTLRIDAQNNNAGIGGNGNDDKNNPPGRLIINGGMVYATGGSGAAGIGGAFGQSGGRVDINGGTVNATGGQNGAGIGGGAGGNGGTITINDGHVTATGLEGGAGIGGGNGGNGGEITINGGTVNAAGGGTNGDGAGIGSGAFSNAGVGSGGVIEIHGGSVNARSFGNGAGIGGGSKAAGGTIRISGGQVTVPLGDKGIGPGKDGKEDGTNIYLSWTEAYEKTMELTAVSYGGTVRTNSHFVIKGTTTAVYQSESVDKSKIAGKTLVPLSDRITTWASLQMWITEAQDGDIRPTTLKLGDNITASRGENAIIIPAGQNIILDLNGFTLSRGLTGSIPEGHVIVVEKGAKLAVVDDSLKGNGAVSGGYSDSHGMGIIVYGELELRGGNISKNKSYYKPGGGAVEVMSGAEFRMSGGSIHDNIAAGGDDYTYVGGSGAGIYIHAGGTAIITGGSVINNTTLDYGGGIFVEEGGTLNLSGCRVTGNWALGGGNGIYVSGTLNLSGYENISNNGNDNLCLNKGVRMNITGTLEQGSLIEIHTEAEPQEGFPIVITNELEDPENVQYLTAYDRDCVVAVNRNNEAVIGRKRTVTFTCETGGSGKMDPITVASGNDFQMPECEFTPPEGLNFAGWRASTGTWLLDAGEWTRIPGDVTFVACFGMPYEDQNGKECSAYKYSFLDENSTEWKDGWYVVDRNMTIDARVSVLGPVKLILKDDTELKLPKGISLLDGNSLTIYAQSDGEHSGKLTSHDDGSFVNYAQIGGDLNAKRNAGGLLICGGRIDVRKKTDGAAIGAGNNGKAGTISIFRGTVTAIGGNDGAGIGGSYYSEDNGAITIGGGTVTAQGGLRAAGIGGGAHAAESGMILITGGTITATGGEAGSTDFGGGAGIGGGYGSTIHAIYISGGEITAYGKDGGAGIGGSAMGSVETIDLSGGQIKAYGSTWQSWESMGIGYGTNGRNTSHNLRMTWTKESLDTMRVYANRFTPDKILDNIFQSTDGDIYVPNKLSYEMDGKTIIPIKGIYNWKTLQEAINEAEDGDVLTVYDDCKAEDSDTALLVPAGKNITIDLNGNSLYRDLYYKTAREGGSVLVNHGTLTITNSRSTGGNLDGGHVLGNGGGIWNDGTLTLRGTVMIWYCKATTQSKSVYTGSGGGIYNEGGTVILYDGVDIRFNEADWRGGGICSVDGKVEIHNATMLRNKAWYADSAAGGGIYISGNKATLTLDNSRIRLCESAKNAGGIYASASIVNITNGSVIENCEAKGNGGGIYGYSMKLTVANSRIDDNKAGEGGGIYGTTQSRINLDGAWVTGNKATGDNGVAGGIYLDDQYVLLNLRGQVQIWNNKVKNGNNSNVYIPKDNKIILGEYDIETDVVTPGENVLSRGASIGITTQETPAGNKPVEFTTKLIPAEDKAKFFSDDPQYTVDVKAEGGAVLGLPATISYIIGQNVGTKNSETAAIGNQFILPADDSFDDKVIPGMKLAGWIVGADEGYTRKDWKKPGESIDVTGDITLVAVFSVPYIAEDGSTKYMDCRILDDNRKDWYAWGAYGYAVVGNVSIGQRTDTSTNTKLILCDGCDLKIKGGISVDNRKSLTIYGQEDQTGKLTVTNTDYDCAGIGGTTTDIAAELSPSSGNSGQITIAGGVIDVTGGSDGAGIGGAYNGRNGAIKILRGTVTVQSGGRGAGIGGGYKANAGNITISGGTVTTTGRNGGAGIGGGGYGSGGNIIISGGNVTARTDATGYEGGYAAAIGGGDDGNSGIIQITGGTVKAMGKGPKAAGIGAGGDGMLQEIIITGGTVTASVDGVYSTAIGGDDGATGSIQISGGMVTAGAAYSTSFGIAAKSVELTWTEANKNSMWLYINRYNSDSVTLVRPFRDLQSNIYMPATLTSNDTGKISNKYINPCESIPIYTWKTLAETVAACGQGRTILKLEGDIKAEKDDTRILISAGQDIVLDLNGHTMDRNIDEGRFTNSGCSFVVENTAALTIRDNRGGGAITGGGNDGSGGAFDVKGTLSIESGTIRNNYAKSSGGAVFLRSGAKLTMTGGTIDENGCLYGGGAIYISSGSSAEIRGGTISNNDAMMAPGGAIANYGTLTVSGGTITGNIAGNNQNGCGIFQSGTMNIQGSPAITGNKTSYQEENNVYLDSGRTMNVTGTLGSGARIGVTTEEKPEDGAVVLTSGLKGKGSTDSFRSDIDEYIIKEDANGEAVLGLGAVVSFNANGGSGSMDPVTVTKGSKYQLPDSKFTPPGKQTFLGWKINNSGEILPAIEKTIDVNENTVLWAQYGTKYYDVWVSGVQISDENKNDILGDGTAQYDPETNVLTLSGASLASQESAETYNGTGIYAKGSLTVRGSGGISASITGIRTGGSLTIDNGADLRITVPQTNNTMAGIQTGGDLTIRNSAVTVTDGFYGLYATGGDITIDNSEATMTTRSIGVNSKTGKVTLRGADTILRAQRAAGSSVKSSAVQSGAMTLTIEEPLNIHSPAEARIDTGVIVEKYGGNATSVVILNYREVKGVSLPEILYMDTGKKIELAEQLVFDPEKATNKEVTWISSAPRVATVDLNTGTVSALKEGETDITVTTAENNKTATTHIIVSKSATTYPITIAQAEHGTVTCEQAFAEKDETVQLTVTPDPGYGIDTLYYETESGQQTNISTKTAQFKMPNKNITIHATFKEVVIHFTVRFDANGGTGTMADQEFTYGQYQELTPCAFILEGKMFDGWEDDDGQPFADGARVRNLSSTDGAVVVLYAQWKTPTYSVTLDPPEPEHGSVSLNRWSAQYGTAIYVTGMPDIGYHIDEATWTPDGGTAQDMEIKANENIRSFAMPAANVTVHMTFSANRYKVLFDANGGEGTMADQTLTYGKEEALAAAGFTRAGYDFTGWNTAEDSSGDAYTDEQPVLNLREEHGDTITLYAQWSIAEYTLTFMDGETVLSTITKPYDTPINPPEDPKKEGYTFTGWSEKVPARMPSENKTLTASWTINRYTLTFDYTGGEDEGGNASLEITADFGTAVTAPENPTLDGYDFLGWDAEIPATMPAKDMIFKARWQKQQIPEYTIFFNTDGGSTIQALTLEQGAPITPLPANPTKTGYSFVEWSPAIPATMPDHDLTVKAKWKINQYTLTLNDTEGHLYKALTQNYNTAIRPPANPTRTGYVFTAWSERLPTRMPAENKTITAQWRAVRYTVKYDANGGSGTMADQAFSYDEAQNLAENSFVRDGYAFSGWKDERGNAYTDKQNVVNLTADDGDVVILRAQWEQTAYNITIQADAGQGTVKLYPAAPYHYGDKITVYVTPVKGYELTSLTYRNGDGASEAITKDGSGAYTFVMPAADTTVTAAFAAIEAATVTISSRTADLYEGDGITLHATVLPEDALDRTVTWASSDPAVATVDTGGNVTAIAEGECTITATTANGKTAACLITVTKRPPTTYSITVNAAQYGRVTADRPEAEAESEVTLTVTPDEGYGLNSLVWQYTEEGTARTEEIDITSGDRKYTFTMPAAAVEVTAVFTPNTYTLTFHSAGGTGVAPITAPYGSPVAKPADPTKTGYTFLGWNDAIPDTMPAQNMRFVARWTINSYTITLRDGDAVLGTITQEYDSEVTAPKVPEKEGYTFIKWDPEIPEKMPAEDTVVRAVWQVNPYTITFMSVDGAVGSITQDYGTVIGAASIPDDPVRTGYEFIGWDPQVPETMPAEDMIITAQWTQTFYPVLPYFNEEQGTVTASVWQAGFGDLITVTVKPYPGYEPSGLTAYAAGKAIETTPGTGDPEGVYTYTFTMPANLTLIYGTFRPVLYNITTTVTEPAKGTLSADRTTASINETVHAAAASDTGYHTERVTLKYGEGVTATATDLQPNALTGGYSFTMPPAHVTVEAAFAANTYAVRYNANGGDGTMADQAFVYDEAQNLAENTFTRRGYSFAGWNTAANGNGTAYADKASVSNLVSENGGTVNLYAQWTINQYTLTFKTDENTTYQTITQDYGTTITAPENPTKTGYNFTGWDSEIPAIMPDVNQTLTAQWEQINYPIRLIFDDALGNVSIQDNKTTAHYNDSITVITVPDEGYQTAGVTVFADSSAMVLTPIGGQPGTYTFTMPASSVEVHVAFRLIPPVPYTITTDNPEGSHGTLAADRTAATRNETVYLITNPEAGYHTGSVTVAYSEGDTATSTDLVPDGQTGRYSFVMPEANVTVSATFDANSYTVHYNENGGSGTIADQTFVYDAAQNLTENTFTRRGYSFNGWNTAANGNGTAYADKASVNNLTSENSGTVNLYAQWTVNRYTLTFKTDESTIYQTITQDYGTTITAPEKPKKTGYTFTGWNSAIPTTMPAENLTLTAQWEQLEYSIIPVSIGSQGTVAVSSAAPYHYGDSVTLTVAPAPGYTLNSLTAVPMSGSETITPTETAEGSNAYTFAMPASNVIVFASFRAIAYQVATEQAEHGIITADRATAVMDETVYLTTKADIGYKTERVTVSYTEGTAVTSIDLTPDNQTDAYSFTMPAADVKVTALFGKELYTVTIDVDAIRNGIVQIKAEGTDPPKTQYEYDEIVELTVTAGVGYELSRLTMQAEGAEAPTDLDITGPYTFHMPAANALIDALFAAVRVKGIALDQTSAGMTVGDTLQLTATLNPERPQPEPLNKKIRWVSSDESVAAVDENGKVTAAGRGEAVITAITADGGYTASCTVTVKPVMVTLTFMPEEAGDAEPVAFEAEKSSEASYPLPENLFMISKGPGYTFAGWKWKLSEDTQDRYGEPGQLVSTPEDITFTAVFGYPLTIDEADHLTITADKAGAKAGDTVTLTVTPDTGYALKNIKTIPEAAVTDNGDGTYTVTMPQSMVTVKAEAAPISYTVKFLPGMDGYSGEMMADQAFVYDEAQRLDENLYTRKGYDFDVWVVLDGNGEATEETLQDMQRVSNLAATDNAVITLRAAWTPTSYPIEFNILHGTVSAAPSDSAPYESTVTLAVTPDPGYHLDSLTWTKILPRTSFLRSVLAAASMMPAAPDDDGDDTIPAYDPATRIEPDEDGNYTFRMPDSGVTVNGVFIANPYTVRFDAGADDAEGEMEDMLMRYDEAQALPANTFTRAGYLFDGWSTSDGSDPDDPGEAYDDQATVINLTEAFDGTVTLYARWKKIRYAVKVDSIKDLEDGKTHGTARLGQTAAAMGESVSLTIEPDPGYKPSLVLLFYAPMTVRVVFPINGNYSFTMPAADVQATVAFTGISYTVAFDANGGSGAMENQLFTYDEEQKLTTNAFTRPGYRFLWWNTAADGTGRPYSDEERLTNLTETDGETITLYAVWEEEEPEPTTPAPTTAAPTTPAPTTPAPTTAAPTTPATTTPAPTTPAPTTAAPTMPAPTTPAPATPTPMPKPDGTPRGTVPGKTAFDIVANRIGIEVTEDGEKKIQLSGSEEIRKIREHYGKGYVLLAGSVDPAQLARILMEDAEADPVEVLAGLIREAEYDAVLPGGASFGTAEAVTCAALAEKEIPVLAANVYYDGTDGEHEAGENVFTPYTVKTVTVDGHEHKAGVLALVFRGEDAAEMNGYLFTHPENEEGTIAGEAARYLPQMREDGCEFIIVYCVGETDTRTDPEDDEALSPAETLILESTGIDLVILPEAPEEVPEGEAYPDRKGRMVPVLRENAEAAECLCLFAESEDGTLIYSLKTR